MAHNYTVDIGGGNYSFGSLTAEQLSMVAWIVQTVQMGSTFAVKDANGRPVLTGPVLDLPSRVVCHNDVVWGGR